MPNRVGIILSAINSFNEDQLKLGIGTTISRIYSPLLITIEVGSLVWHIVKFPLETIAKIFLCPLKCCPCLLGKAIKRWDKALDPLDTVAKVIKLSLGIISSLLLAWSIPTWNVGLHWSIDRLPGNKIFGEQLAKIERDKTNLLIQQAHQPLLIRIEEAEKNCKSLEELNRDLEERVKSLSGTNELLHHTSEQQGQTILSQQEQLTKMEEELRKKIPSQGEELKEKAKESADPLNAIARINPDQAAKMFIDEAAAAQVADTATSSSSVLSPPSHDQI